MTYNDFINNILTTRGRFGINNNEYKERHHIIPKCMGGTDDKDNLIDLYAYEHFIAHKLLFEENRSNNKLALAYWKMANTPRGYVVEPEDYEEARLACKNIMSLLHTGSGNPMFNKNPRAGKTSEELKDWDDKKSKSLKKYFLEHPGIRAGENNSMYGKNAYEGKSAEEMAEISRKKSLGVSGSKNSHAKYVINIDTLRIFSTIKDVYQWLISKDSSIGCKDITNCCMGRIETAGGYHWLYIDDYISKVASNTLCGKINFTTNYFKQQIKNTRKEEK